jgi:hypothetical protein
VKGCWSSAKGTELHQSDAALVSLRNAFVHFKPEWDDSLNKHQKLEAKLWLKDADERTMTTFHGFR